MSERNHFIPNTAINSLENRLAPESAIAFHQKMSPISSPPPNPQDPWEFSIVAPDALMIQENGRYLQGYLSQQQWIHGDPGVSYKSPFTWAEQYDETTNTNEDIVSTLNDSTDKSEVSFEKMPRRNSWHTPMPDRMPEEVFSSDIALITPTDSIENFSDMIGHTSITSQHDSTHTTNRLIVGSPMSYRLNKFYSKSHQKEVQSSTIERKDTPSTPTMVPFENPIITISNTFASMGTNRTKMEVGERSTFTSVTAANNLKDVSMGTETVTPVQKNTARIVQKTAVTQENPTRSKLTRKRTPPKKATTVKPLLINKQSPFPEIVHVLVTECASTDETIVSWVQNGEAFIFHHTGPKLGRLLRKYFDHGKYSSLQRQLNMYGFKKCKQGKYAGGFWHPNFHRDHGERDELAKIKRRGPPARRPSQSSGKQCTPEPKVKRSKKTHRMDQESSALKMPLKGSQQKVGNKVETQEKLDWGTSSADQSTKVSWSPICVKADAYEPNQA
eukprot:scaffold3824_cov48-Attheya_sp.AAC.2